MHNPGLIKSLRAGAAIAPNRIVKFGSDDLHVVQAAAASDALIGVTTLGATAAEQACDFATEGLATVEYGGAVTRGAFLTADAQGRAIAATTAGQRVIGVAMVSGVSGDLGSVKIAPGTYAVAGGGGA